jgi:SAM-dependent methyltransferase
VGTAGELDVDADGWDKRYEAEELVWGLNPKQWLVIEAEELPPGRALDLGCGEGRNALWLAGRGWLVTGVDFAGVALARAAQLAEQAGVAPRVTWVQADVSDSSTWGMSFDLVVVAYLHQISTERRSVLRAAAQVLAPRGTLLVIAHDLSNLAKGIGGPQDPNVLFTPEDVVEDLADLPGLLVLRAERGSRSVLTPDGPRVAYDVLVRVLREQ